MQNLNHQKIIIALLLLWLALTGGYVGWSNPFALFVNFLLWLGLMIWLCVRVPRLDRIGWAIIGLMAANLISAAITHHWYAGLTRSAILSVYLAIYNLARQWPDGVISQGAFVSLIIYLFLCCSPWGNPNVLAFNLIGLAWLAWPIGEWGILLFVGLFILAYLKGSTGGMLALLSGGAFVAWKLSKHRLVQICLVSLIIPLLIFGWFFGDLITASSERLVFFIDAAKDFISSPLWGLGPGAYRSLTYWHSHNLVLTTAAELGFLGLLALGALAWVIWKSWSSLPIWAAALTVSFAVWSLVDEPTQFWGPGAMLMMAWSRRREEK